MCLILKQLALWTCWPRVSRIDMESTKDTFKRDGHLQSRHVCVGMSPEPVTVGHGEACEHVKVTMQKDQSSRNLGP